MEFNFEEFKKLGAADKPPRTTGEAPRAQCMKVVEEMQKMKGLNSKEKAMAIISGICQRGGTNRSANTISTTFGIQGAFANSKEFGDVCKKYGMTPRQFARTMASDIYKFAEIMQEEGDLSRQMAADYPNLSMEERVWCSNFQTTNPDCPENVRAWLVNNFRNRFAR